MVLATAVTQIIACHRPSEFPEDIDYEIMQKAFLVGLRSANQAIYNKWQLLMEKFLTQLRVAVRSFQTKERHAHRANSNLPSPSSLHKLMAVLEIKGDQHRQSQESFKAGQRFMHWLSQTLLNGLYPGATSVKKMLCLESLCTALKIWNPFLNEKTKISGQSVFVPFSDALLSYDSVEVRAVGRSRGSFLSSSA